MLRVSDLTGKDLERTHQNHETYKMLYEKCALCIKQRNDLGHVWLRHTVPGYVVGRPLFSIDHAKRYIREKLVRGKFTVEEFEGDLIVFWGKEKEKTIRKLAGGGKSKKSRHANASKRPDTVSGTSRKRGKEVDMRLSGTNSGSKKGKTKNEEPLGVRLARLNFNMNRRSA